MENKIIFLLIAIIVLYLLLTKAGKNLISNLVTSGISTNSSSTSSSSTNSNSSSSSTTQPKTGQTSISNRNSDAGKTEQNGGFFNYDGDNSKVAGAGHQASDFGGGGLP